MSDSIMTLGTGGLDETQTVNAVLTGESITIDLGEVQLKSTDPGLVALAGGQVGSNATVEFMVFRLHSAALTQAQMLQNYNADAWRMALHYPYRAGNKLMKICAVG